jgi:hypothetical protein
VAFPLALASVVGTTECTIDGEPCGYYWFSYKMYKLRDVRDELDHECATDRGITARMMVDACVRCRCDRRTS